MPAATLIGIDIGGTFTDFVVYKPVQGSLFTFKLLSTPDDPSTAVLDGLERIKAGLSSDDALGIIHGSTVATNALLERKGARTALIATRGFKDMLQIGRQNRPELYNLKVEPAPALVPPELRFEVDERIGSNGEVLHPLDPAQAEALVPMLQTAGVESAAVCLLFSFVRPEHERIIATRLREAGIFTSASFEVLPEFREYERASTTTVNAYVSPTLNRYLSRLETAVAAASMRVMQSNGGSISLSEARRSGVRCVLSGPAGGVVAAGYLAKKIAANAHAPIRVITFDMGGTSTDVSLIAGEPQPTTEAVVGGYPIRVPVLDIHTIGAGGGSIASVDAGGALRVGPQSAGANPGPACYGRGELPTVTDANLVLGRLSAEFFMGGEFQLDVQRAQQALERLGTALGLTAEEAAEGIIEVANAHMERALRVISVERGYDPRDFALLSFGGAGGLHATDLARRVGIPQVLVPQLASTFSAFGMLAADIVKDYTQTVMLPADAVPDEIRRRFDPMIARGKSDLSAEGVSPEILRIECAADLRYRGQSYEITLPYVHALADAFHRAHAHAYGYARPDAPVEIVNLRVRAIGPTQPPRLMPLTPGGSDPAAAKVGEYPVIWTGRRELIALYHSESLRPGNRIPGPALVARSDTSIWIGPQDCACVDDFGSLQIAVGG